MRKLIFVAFALILIGAGCGKSSPSSSTRVSGSKSAMCPSIEEIGQTCSTNAKLYSGEVIGRTNAVSGFSLDCSYLVSGGGTFAGLKIDIYDLDSPHATQDWYNKATENLILNKKVVAQNEIGSQSVRGITIGGDPELVFMTPDSRVATIESLENGSMCNIDKLLGVGKLFSDIKPGAIRQAAKEKFSVKECIDTNLKVYGILGEGDKEILHKQDKASAVYDECYRRQAGYENDISLCEKISEKGRKNDFGTNEYDECLMTFIRTSKNKTLCEKMFLKDNKENCFRTLSSELRDANICNLMSSGDFSPSDRELCITDIAVKLKDPKVCDTFRPEDEDAYVSGDKVHKKGCLRALGIKD